MPDVWTHIICGREVLAGVDENFRRLALARKELFFLGCQGPDLFFYYNFLPWDEDRRVFFLGSRIHHEKCGNFFRESLLYAKQKNDAATTVYLMALMCHWCLDRVTHPYINYISGIYRGNKGETRKLINNHKRVEAAIDVLMGLMFINKKVKRTPAHREINVGNSLPGEVVAYYQYILPLVFADSYEELQNTDFINKSYRDMISALKVLYDPWGIKWSLAALYDALSRDVLNLRYYFYRSPEKNRKAYLNEEKRPWCHPMDEKEVYTDSFLELFQRGIGESVELINLSLRFIRGEAGEAEINEKLKDISYSTGKPESDQRTMRYFKPVLEGEDN